MLDASAQEAVPIVDTDITLNLVIDSAPQQVKIAAVPQTGGPTGQASRFSTNDARVFKALEAPKATAQLNVAIAGKTYTDKIEHHDTASTYTNSERCTSLRSQ